AARFPSGCSAGFGVGAVGHLAARPRVGAGLVLPGQFIALQAQGPAEPRPAVGDDPNDLRPPAPSYGPWLPLGAAAATVAVFLGGWLAKQFIRLPSSPDAHGATRKLMNWLIDAAARHPGPG